MRFLYRLKLKQRMAISLVLMVVGLTITSFMIVSSYWDRHVQVRGMVQAAHAIELVSHIVHELQKERAKSVLFLNQKATQQELDQQRSEVDARIENLSKFINTDSVAADLTQAEEQNVKNLNALRERMLAPVSPAEVAAGIASIVDAWIAMQTRYANRFHLDGHEARLVSISIFEKSKESMGRLRALLNSILGADKSIAGIVVSQLSSHRAGILTNLDSPGLSIGPESRKEIDSLLAANDWQSVEKVFEQVIRLSAEGGFGQDAKSFSATITKVIDGVRQVILSEITTTIGFLRETEATAYRVFWVCLLSASALVLTSVAMAFFVIRSTTESLVDVSTFLANGAEKVAQIAAQVEAGSQNLSASTTQQAAALQETTAAVEESSAMVKRNAENAVSSTEISERSKSSAAQGQKTVSEMIGSIREISQSTEEIMKQVEENNQQMTQILAVINEIGSKTKVINDIVFQTKLLSFNASVEAARAGEHGKGFSVVAEEIGALAQMSGNASKEISTLLDESTKNVESIVVQTRQRVEELLRKAEDRVEKGTQNANRCGEILDAIVHEVSSVSAMLGEISMASEEQSKGIQEITGAMSQLDQAAQQNSRSSQEMSASAGDLNTQVGELNRVMQQLIQVVHGTDAA